jgi:hypothetical protein
MQGAHAAYMFGLNSETVTKLFAYIYLSYATYAGGVVVYATRFPECLFPGSFNIWVRHSSHSRVAMFGEFTKVRRER